jgi:hypothetical protein
VLVQRQPKAQGDHCRAGERVAEDHCRQHILRLRQQASHDRAQLLVAFGQLAHLPFAQGKSAVSASEKKKLAPAEITITAKASIGAASMR